MTKNKKLKIFNGPDHYFISIATSHLYVAAYSQKDAIDLLNEAYRKYHNLEGRKDVKPFTYNLLKTYWNKGCWGTNMKGIEVERGVWLSKDLLKNQKK